MEGQKLGIDTASNLVYHYGRMHTRMLTDFDLRGKLVAKKTLGKIYRLRRAIKNKKSLEVTFPYEVVEKKAISKGLSVEEFLKHYHAIATSTRKGVYYTFEEANHEEENPIPQRAGHQSDSYTDAPA